ncbi:MAG: hypothetical protein IT257_03345 [Chitinophagaceae bacterium]|nr:hypothetical protein [Chitinophagaceae bacterium]
MFFILICLVFALIPVSSILLCFLKDDRRIRKLIMNGLLLANAFLFLSPFIYAYLSTFPDGNMWSENGPGAVFWFYYFLFPGCFVVQIVLLILKLTFRPARVKTI